MAETGSFRVSVVTPEREVLAVEATFAAFPAFDGEMGILPGRAALLSQLGSGILRVRESDGGERRLFVSGGFAQMAGDRLTLLTEEARDPATLDRTAVESGFAAANALAAHGEHEFERKQRALDRARSIQRLAGGR